jgi:hypothetical protein
MVKELLQGTTKWFKAKMGLCDQGLDIKKEKQMPMHLLKIVRPCLARGKVSMVLGMMCARILLWLQESKNCMLFIKNK